MGQEKVEIGVEGLTLQGGGGRIYEPKMVDEKGAETVMMIGSADGSKDLPLHQNQ